MTYSNYTIGIGPYTGTGPTYELTFYSSWTLDKNIDDGCTFSFTIPGYVPEAAAISELDTDVWVYRSGVLNQRFRIVAVNQAWGPSGEDTISVQAVCYRRLLATRYVQSPLRFDQVSQGQIIWELIQHTQATTNGDLGITAGSLGPTVLRDRSYEVGQNILDIIVDMTNVIGGPTWDIDENLELVVSRSDLYSQNPAPLVLGATVEAFQRPSSASKFGNVALVSGSQQSTTTVIAESPGLVTDPRGRWERRAAYPSVVLQDTLQDHADGLLTDLQAALTIWQVDVVAERYFGDGDYKLGEFVTLVQPASTAAPISVPAVNIRGQILAIQVQQDNSSAVNVSMRVLEIGPTVEIEYLVVGGGGAGGGSSANAFRGGGGGGAGGYRSSVTGESSGGGVSAEPVFVATIGTPYPLVVGAGGTGNAGAVAGSNGVDSQFATVVSDGGGGGGPGISGIGNASGLNGGSGGGLGTGLTGSTGSGGSGTTGQGFAGGTDTVYEQVIGCGGGGADQAGFNRGAGGGGAGVDSLVTGLSVFRGGGGGGGVGNAGADNPTVRAAGAGGGGAGGYGVNGSNGSANTGGGGGGAGGSASQRTGGSGGSGVIILRVPTTLTATFSSGVTQTSPTPGVYVVTAAGPTDTVTFS